ncbi:MAG: hypothetical protein K9J74_08205 [Sulfuritalea sp.]|nr:hypothetical protein [Sulfuritalea sp.]
MRLYDETRDKQGEAAKKAWSEVDLKTYFQSQRDERKKLLQAELESITLHTMTRRENSMRVVAGGTVTEFSDTLGDELSNLLDGKISQLDKWDNANRALTLRRKNLAFSRDLLSLHAPGLSNCAAALKSSAILPDRANRALEDFKSSCAKEKEASGKVAELEKTIGGTYWLAFEKEAKRVSEAKENATEKTSEYKAALKAYEDAVKSDSAEGAKPSEKIAELAGKLRTALDALLKLQDKFGFAKEAIAKEKVNTLDELLEKVESAVEPGKDAGHAEIQALMLPKIADDLHAIDALNKTTPKTALIIRRDIEKGRADAAALEVSYAEQRVALSKLILASRFEEALLIRSAQKKLASVMEPSLATKTFTAAYSEAGEKIKTSLIGAAGDYLDAIGRQRSHTQRLETMKMTIAHERSIGYAENSAGQWSSLIGSVVGQASEYAAGGQKFSEYKDLIQSIALLWIGGGVNK